MALMQPFDGENFFSKFYQGERADKMFCSGNITVLMAACQLGKMGNTLLALYAREIELSPYETGIYYCPSCHERTAEILRFFSYSHAGFEAAHQLFSDLVEELDYESIEIASPRSH